MSTRTIAGLCALVLVAALAPAPPQDSFTFLHASDPHINLAGVARLERVRQIVIERKPAFVIVSGDLVADALSAGEAEARRLFELYVNAVKTFPVPVHSALGNHDIFGIDREASKVTPDHPLYGKKMFRHYLGPDYYSFDRGELHVVVLDTVDVEGAKYYGHVDTEQLEWLGRDLAAVAPGAAVVAVTHIPLLTGALAAWGYREGTGAGDTLVEIGGRRVFRHVVSNAPDVLARFSNVRLSLVLGGHTHLAERLAFEFAGPRVRFEQAASIAPPFEGDPLPAESGVTLYRVKGTQIDGGEFIELDR